jgi:hypothetical protein
MEQGRVIVLEKFNYFNDLLDFRKEEEKKGRFHLKNALNLPLL